MEQRNTSSSFQFGSLNETLNCIKANYERNLLNYVSHVLSCPTCLVLCVLSCLTCLIPYMLSCPMCLLPYVISYLTCFVSYVLSCLRCLVPYVLPCLTCAVLYIPSFLACLASHVLSYLTSLTYSCNSRDLCHSVFSCYLCLSVCALLLLIPHLLQ